MICLLLVSARALFESVTSHARGPSSKLECWLFLCPFSEVCKTVCLIQQEIKSRFFFVTRNCCWFCYGSTMVLFWFYRVSIVVPWWFCHGSIVFLLWFYGESNMVLSWFYYGSMVILLWLYRGSITVLLYCIVWFFMALSCFIMLFFSRSWWMFYPIIIIPLINLYFSSQFFLSPPTKTTALCFMAASPFLF